MIQKKKKQNKPTTTPEKNPKQPNKKKGGGGNQPHNVYCICKASAKQSLLKVLEHELVKYPPAYMLQCIFISLSFLPSKPLETRSGLFSEKTVSSP